MSGTGLQARKQDLTQAKPYQQPALRLPASRSAKNKWLLFKPLGAWGFVTAAHAGYVSNLLKGVPEDSTVLGTEYVSCVLGHRRGQGQG